MDIHGAARRGAGLGLCALFGVTSALARPFPPKQKADPPCLVCHADKELRSLSGKPVFVEEKTFAESVHGRAGTGCVGCHADLEGVEDFPHSPELRAVSCARCHGRKGWDSPADVHGSLSPRLARKPVFCKDCHGYHDVFRSSDGRSAAHLSNRPGTCGRCHPGAGVHYAAGRVHESGAAGRRSPAGIVRIVYQILICAASAFFLAYIAFDILRWRRER